MDLLNFLRKIIGHELIGYTIIPMNVHMHCTLILPHKLLCTHYAILSVKANIYFFFFISNFHHGEQASRTKNTIYMSTVRG